MDAWIALLAVTVSVISAFSSLVFARRAQSANREANRIQQEMLDLARSQERARQDEANRAHWSAWVSPRGDSEQIVVRNDGPGTAQDVSIFLDDHRFEDHPDVLFDGAVPTVLQPQGEVRSLIVGTFGSPPISVVRIVWDDDEGATHEFETQVR